MVTMISIGTEAGRSTKDSCSVSINYYFSLRSYNMKFPIMPWVLAAATMAFGAEPPIPNFGTTSFLPLITLNQPEIFPPTGQPLPNSYLYQIARGGSDGTSQRFQQQQQAVGFAASNRANFGAFSQQFPQQDSIGTQQKNQQQQQQVAQDAPQNDQVDRGDRGDRRDRVNDGNNGNNNGNNNNNRNNESSGSNKSSKKLITNNSNGFGGFSGMADPSAFSQQSAQLRQQILGPNGNSISNGQTFTQQPFNSQQNSQQQFNPLQQLGQQQSQGNQGIAQLAAALAAQQQQQGPSGNFGGLQSQQGNFPQTGSAQATLQQLQQQLQQQQQQQPVALALQQQQPQTLVPQVSSSGAGVQNQGLTSQQLGGQGAGSPFGQTGNAGSSGGSSGGISALGQGGLQGQSGAAGFPGLLGNAGQQQQSGAQGQLQGQQQPGFPSRNPGQQQSLQIGGNQQQSLGSLGGGINSGQFPNDNVVKGQYRVGLPDGRVQIVRYIALVTYSNDGSNGQPQPRITSAASNPKAVYKAQVELSPVESGSHAHHSANNHASNNSKNNNNNHTNNKNVGGGKYDANNSEKKKRSGIDIEEISVPLKSPFGQRIAKLIRQRLRFKEKPQQ